MTNIEFGIKLRYDGKEVTGGLVVSRDQFRQLAAEAKKAGEATASGFSGAAQGVRSISAQLDQAKRALIGYFGVVQGAQAIAQGGRWILDQASAMTQLDARLKVATSSQAEYVRASAGVFEVANRWGAAVSETAATFARLNPVVAQLGGTSATTLKMMDGLAASLRLSGATAAETSAVLLQFSQAMGSGRVGGDEFRSMMENAEPLMRAVATELGKTSGELRQMAEDGKLTSSVFGNALLPAIEKLKAQAEQIPLGISQAWQVLENNLKRDFGREFNGQATVVGAAIKGLSDHSAEAAAAVHALADGFLAVGQAALVVGAGATATWITKQGEAAIVSTQAFLAARAARIADAQAAELQAAADVKRAQTTLALMTAERERVLASLASSNATLQATVAVGAHSAALRFGAEAAGQKSAALLLLADTSKIQSIATRELTVAEAAHAAAQARTAEATAINTGAAKLAGGAMTALGGPIGLVTTALTAGLMAWALWGSGAESAADKAKKKLKELEKAARFGTGEIADLMADNARLESERVKVRHSTKAEAALQAKIDENTALIAKLKAAEKHFAEKATSEGGERLSSAGQWGKLTESLKWREKLLEQHGKEAEVLATSYNDSLAEAVKKGLPTDKIVADYRAASRAMAAEQKSALENLPDAKEGKRLATEAARTAKEQWDNRLKAVAAGTEQERALIERAHAAGTLSEEDYQQDIYRATIAGLGKRAAALQTQMDATTGAADRVKLAGEIEAVAAEAGKASDAYLLALAKMDRARADFWATGRQDHARAAAEEAESLLQKAAAAEAENATIGLTVGALAELTAQRHDEQIALKEAAAEGLRGIKGREGELYAIEQQIAALRRLKSAEVARPKLQAQAREWERFADDIERALTDALMRGFESGKGLGQNFVDTLKNTLKSAALKFAVQMVVDPIMGTVRGAVSGSATSVTSAASGWSNLNTSPFNNGFQKFGLSNVGESFGLSKTIGFDLDGSIRIFSATGEALDSAAKFMDSYGGYAAAVAQLASGNIAGAIGAAVGQYFGGPIGSFIGSTLMSAIFGDDDKNPDDYYRFSGLSNHATINKSGFTGEMFDFYGAGGSTYRALPEDIESGLDKALEKLFVDMKQMAVLAGNAAVELDDLTVAVSHTGKGLEADIEAAVNTTADAIAQKLIPNIKDFQAAGESLSQTFTRLAQAAVAARLTSMSSMAAGIHDIGGARLNVATSRFGIASQMKGFDALGYWGDVSKGLFNQVHAADFQTLPTATRLSVAGKLQEAIGSSYQAQVAHFTEIRDARLKALQAEQAAAEQAAAASRSAYESAAQTASAMASALHQIADYAAKLNVSDLSTLSPEAKLAEAARQYESLLAGARGGDAAATGQLTGGADVYLQSARDYFASGADYASIFTSVQSALTGVGAGAAGYDAQAASLASIAASTQGSFDMAGRQAAIDAEFNAEIKSWQENALKQYDSLDGLMGDWQGDLQSRLDEEVLSLSAISGGVDLMVTSIASMGEDIGGIVASAIERVSDAQNETLKVLVRITEAGNQANVDRLAALERRLSQIEANGTLAGGAP